MLFPKKTKYRKAHKGRIKGYNLSNFKLNNGSFGLKALEPGRITARQIEACRRAIVRKMKRTGKVWINIFPDLPVSSKPAEVRMGKGKGALNYWCCRVKPGKVLFEVDGVADFIAKDALRLGSAKLCIRTKITTLF